MWSPRRTAASSEGEKASPLKMRSVGPQEEKEEKALRQAEMELKKGENIMEHEKEIFSRPARTWFQTEKEKQNAKGIASAKEYETFLLSSYYVSYRYQ